MKTETLIAKLKKEASQNETAKDLFISWAVRKRARRSVMLAPLAARMQTSGFKHTEGEYAEVLEFLAGLGIGNLDRDPKGLVRGLKDIKLALQSIGQAAVDATTDDNGSTLRAIKSKRIFGKLRKPEPAPVVQDEPKAVVAAPVSDRRINRVPRPYQTPDAKVIMTFLVNDRYINVPLPPDMAPDEVAELVTGFQGANFKPNGNKDL